MNTEKAEKDIQDLFDKGLSFKYDFDNVAINKYNLHITKEGFSMVDIISKLKENETITFLLNDGRVWDRKKEKFMYNYDYDGSIYHNFHPFGGGDIVRISSDMGSLKKWLEKEEDNMEELTKNGKRNWIKWWLQKFGNRDNETFNYEITLKNGTSYTLLLQYTYDEDGEEYSPFCWASRGFKDAHKYIENRTEEELDDIIEHLKNIQLYY